MNPTDNQNTREDNLDIRRFLIKILLNWPLFVVSIGIAYSIAYLINRYTEPQYSVSTSILISEDRKSTSEILIPALERFNMRKNAENEISVLKSYTLARKTISELDFNISYFGIGRIREPQLYKSCFFRVEIDSSLQTRENYPILITVIDENNYQIEIDNEYKLIKTLKFGEPFRHPNFNFTIHLNREQYLKSGNAAQKSKYYFIVNNINDLTIQYQSKLSLVLGEKKGTVVTLTTSGPVAEKETNFLNKLCEVYIRNGLEEKNKAAINSIKFIDDQLVTISDSLKKAEQRLLHFQQAKKIVDISKEGENIYSILINLQANKVNIELQLKYYDYLTKYLESKSEFNDIIVPSVVGINDPFFNSLISELSEINKQKAVLAYSANNDNPTVSMINLKIQKIVASIKENIKETITTSQIRLKDINERLAKEEIELEKIPINERQLLRIQRGYDLNSNLLTFLLQRRAEAGIAKASNMPDNKIIDVARPENAVQISPKRSKNYMIAMFLGIIVPLLIIFIAELFNTTIVDLKDLEKLKKCNVLGTIGHNIKVSELPVFENPKSALSESFRSLRTNLQYILREQNEKVILVTSTISGEGKTFCAMNLAAILAMSNKKTLLIGLDLRKPKLHKLFNIPNEKGLSTYLIDRDKKEDIIQRTNVNNLFILPSGPIPPNPAELIETERMKNLINELKKEYDFIILDTPPIAIVTDALLTSNFADTTIFVVRQNFSSKEVLSLADDLVERGNMKYLNILVNDVKVQGYYGYSYKYGYRYGSSYRYGYSYYNYDHEYYGEPEIPRNMKERIKKWLGV